MSQELIQQRQREIESIYKPQEQFIQQQKAALPGQFDGQRSALEQAKVNAFRDVGLQAQRRGMFFSGFQPAEQARYLGEKFLPGMQDIAARQEQSRLGLLEKLIGLRTQKAGEMNTFREQLRREALERQQQEEAFRRQLEMQNRQFSQQRSLASGGGGGGGSAGGGQPRQWGKAGRKEGGGFFYRDPGGLPVSAAQYAFNNNIPLEQILSGDDTRYAQQARAVLTGNVKSLPIARKDLRTIASSNSYQARLQMVRSLFPKLF
jgi:hypothetical protein